MTITNQTADFGNPALRTGGTLKKVLAGVGTLLFGLAIYYAAGFLIADGTVEGRTAAGVACSFSSSSELSSERSTSERMLSRMPSASCHFVSQLSSTSSSVSLLSASSSSSSSSSSESVSSRVDSVSSLVSSLS